MVAVGQITVVFASLPLFYQAFAALISYYNINNLS